MKPLARCEEEPAEELWTVLWQVAGPAGEVLGQVNPADLEGLAAFTMRSVSKCWLNEKMRLFYRVAFVVSAREDCDSDARLFLLPRIVSLPSD